MPSNEDAWELFKAAGTQWRTGGFSIIGLDYVAVYKIAEILGIELTPKLHQQLRILESLQLEKMHKKGG